MIIKMLLKQVTDECIKKLGTDMVDKAEGLILEVKQELERTVGTSDPDIVTLTQFMNAINTVLDGEKTEELPRNNDKPILL